MANNSFRPQRRDTPGRVSNPAPRESASDPLAELARLIGQNDSRAPQARPGEAEPYDQHGPAPQLDWAAADEDYAEGRDQPAHPPAQRDDYPSQAPAATHWADEPQHEDEPASASYYPTAPDHHESHAPMPRGEPLAYIPPVGDGHRDDYDAGDGAEYADEKLEENTRPRRSGTIVILAVLGLAIFGTAGALGYRAMFGGSVIPSLPPIIKPGDTPIKVVPSHDAQSGQPNGADPGGKPSSGDHLAKSAEQPVDVQTANVPRVVTTIPVMSNPQQGSLPGAPPPDAPNASLPPAPPSGNAAIPGTPPPRADQAPPAAPAASLPSPSPPTSKRVHTVTIHADPAASGNPAPGAAAPRPAAKPAKSTPETATAGPLSLVPNQDHPPVAAPAPPRTRTAMAPVPLSSAAPAESAPAHGGGYAVQVSSQKSEGEAQAAFRSLQAKYPQQLGGKHAMFRRADLGPKGVYYRAMVGPFASSEQASQLCGSLKAAGASCIVQKD